MTVDFSDLDFSRFLRNDAVDILRLFISMLVEIIFFSRIALASFLDFIACVLSIVISMTFFLRKLIIPLESSRVLLAVSCLIFDETFSLSVFIKKLD